MHTYTPSWTSYVISGAAAIVLSWVISGCDFSKFGNHYEAGEPPENPDQISGYYETEAQTLDFCAALSGEGQLACASRPTAETPAFLASLMGNPVGIYHDIETGDTQLFNPARDPAPVLPTQVNGETLEIQFFGSAGAETFWKGDTTCTRTLHVSEQGMIHRYDEPRSVDWNERLMYGTVEIVFTVMDEIVGDGCDTVLQEIAACYNDAADCGGSDATENAELQDTARAIFGDWVETGAITTAEIPSAEILLYEVSYQ